MYVCAMRSGETLSTCLSHSGFILLVIEYIYKLYICIHNEQQDNNIICVCSMFKNLF